MARTWVFEEGHAAYPGIAQGGLVCGAAASLLDGPTAHVTLRHPPRVGEVLTGDRRDHDAATLRLGAVTVAEARPTELRLSIPPPITMEQAEAAARSFPALPHPTPWCFCCGPERNERDALRILAGPVEGRALAAAPWIPHPAFGHDGVVTTEHVWAALDCPGLWGAAYTIPVKPSVTVRMSADLIAPVRIGEPHVVVGWLVEQRGRKTVCGSALLSVHGETIAAARADWVETRAAAAAVSKWGSPEHRSAAKG